MRGPRLRGPTCFLIFGIWGFWDFRISGFGIFGFGDFWILRTLGLGGSAGSARGAIPKGPYMLKGIPIDLESRVESLVSIGTLEQRMR